MKQHANKPQPLFYEQDHIVEIGFIHMSDAPPIGELKMGYLEQIPKARLQQRAQCHCHSMIWRWGRSNDQKLSWVSHIY